jgi:hypothetical protein
MRQLDFFSVTNYKYSEGQLVEHSDSSNYADVSSAFQKAAKVLTLYMPYSSSFDSSSELCSDQDYLAVVNDGNCTATNLANGGLKNLTGCKCASMSAGNGNLVIADCPTDSKQQDDFCYPLGASAEEGTENDFIIALFGR